MGNGHTTYGAAPAKSAAAPAARKTVSAARIDCGDATGAVVARRRGRASEPAPDPMTVRALRIWGAGAYDRISQGFRHEAEAAVRRLGLRPGERVLDAACGSGNQTIPAARTGAFVTGIDIVPDLLSLAGRWRDQEQLDISLDQGTVEALPYPDAHFDTVISMFGVMFAAQPQRVVGELARVTRPGGRVVLANWVRDGFIGRMLAMHAALVPPPEGISSPLLWGDDARIREWFAPGQWTVTTTRRTLTFRYPHTPAGTAELFRGSYGPTVRTFEALDEDRRAQFARDLAAHWESHNRPGPAQTEVPADYLEVVAVRAQGNPEAAVQ